MAKTLTKSYQLLGSASTSTYSQLRLYGKYNSQNEATLKSNITLQLRLYGNGGSGSFSSGTARINSSSSSLGSTSYSKGKETTLKTLTYDVQHDSNGNYSASVSGFLHTSSSSMTDKTITQTIIVPQIKAKSTATATPNPADIGSTITINTNRVSSSYTHTLTYAFGSLSGTIGTNIGASTTWTIPTSFYAEIPDAALGTCVITCQTFNSSGTSLGTTTLNLMIQAFTPPIINSISYASTDSLTLSLADSSTLISGVSTGTLSVNATAQNSATLSSVDFAIANNEIIGTDTSISGQTTATGTFSGTFSSPTIMAYVYDSRNNYAVSSNYSYTFIDYVQLSVDSGATLKRPAQTDDFVVIESYKGALWQGNFGQQTNSLTLQYRYKLHSDSDSSYSAWTTIPSSAITLNSANKTYSISNYRLPLTLSHTQVYDIQFQATDKVMTTEPYTYTIKLGIPNFAVFPNHLYFGNDNIFDSSNGNLTINGTAQIKNGLYCRPTGQANTPVGNSMLVIKRVTNSEAPNNGVVLEFGNSTNWTGQLFIGDNATQGIYYNGWSDGTRGSWRRLADVPVVLYDNSTGTNGSVTLSSSAANYTYLEIFYRGNDSQYSSVKVYSPNGKDVSLLASLGYNSRIYFKQKVVNISGTSISNKNYSQGWFNGSNQQGWSNDNNIYITRVLGYY